MAAGRGMGACRMAAGFHMAADRAATTGGQTAPCRIRTRVGNGHQGVVVVVGGRPKGEGVRPGRWDAGGVVVQGLDPGLWSSDAWGRTAGAPLCPCLCRVEEVPGGHRMERTGGRVVVGGARGHGRGAGHAARRMRPVRHMSMAPSEQQ